jgi:hypothetical protein
MVQDLDGSEVLSLGDSLSALGESVAVLDMKQLDGSLLAITPEMEKAMRKAEKALQQLKIGSDPI